MDVAHLLAVAVHTLAFVIAWGYYGILGRIVLPALERSIEGSALGASIAAIERRALPLVALSAVLFTVSGSYLLVADPHYRGLGDVFASSWTVLILVKHVVIAGLVVLAVAVDIEARRVARSTEEPERRRALRRLSLEAEATTGLGALVVLLTAAAQAAT
ncbi:MAG TPA: hypothetical protein VEY67_12985 [Candidatus Dormibacteraeota bacterium]|nr:hypothetical protein [Candidatus Dormibacteraeota bacterium]